MLGRHTGVFESPFGPIAPTDNQVRVRTIDVLSYSADRVSSIWVQADDLGLIRQIANVSIS